MSRRLLHIRRVAAHTSIRSFSLLIILLIFHGDVFAPSQNAAVDSEPSDVYTVKLLWSELGKGLREFAREARLGGGGVQLLAQAKTKAAVQSFIQTYQGSAEEKLQSPETSVSELMEYLQTLKSSKQDSVSRELVNKVRTGVYEVARFALMTLARALRTKSVDMLGNAVFADFLAAKSVIDLFLSLLGEVVAETEWESRALLEYLGRSGSALREVERSLEKDL